MLAFVVLQKTLHLPVIRREVHVDYLGATLLVAGVSHPAIWVSLAGSQFDWVSADQRACSSWAARRHRGRDLRRGAGRRRADHPAAAVPRPDHRLATGASVLVGLAMFGSTVYLSQYFQLARGMSPTKAGLMSVAMVGGLLVSSIVTGRIITATGRWKRVPRRRHVVRHRRPVLLSTIDETTSLWVVGAFMAVLGLGLGASMQNLVLAVQNSVAQSDLGAASSVVTFFRSIGGTIGVSALGALLSHQVAASVADGLARLGVQMGAHEQGSIPTSPRSRSRSAPSSSTPSARRPGTCSWSPPRSRRWP